MPELYRITYQAENTYEHPVIEATWQFLIIPEENASQRNSEFRFTNSAGATWERTTNGFGFPVLRVRNRSSLQHIDFEAEFRLVKEAINPFDFDAGLLRRFEALPLHSLDFRIAFSTFLRPTPLTELPGGPPLYPFDPKADLLNNLQGLNQWVFEDLIYTPGLTHVDTPLSDIVQERKGVCQDFSHLFIAICRKQGVPARYVSGYLHQGLGFFGDANMHAWAEAYIPDLGWVGFDPTNNILAATDHVKVAHGRDYNDCAPIKGVMYGHGDNESKHSVQVQTQQ